MHSNHSWIQGRVFTGSPRFIFLLYYNGSEAPSVFSVSVVLLQNLNNSLFFFWNMSPHHNYFFNLTSGRVLVVQQYWEIWTFQEIWKCLLHQPKHCLISQRRGNAHLPRLAFSITAIMDRAVVGDSCYGEIVLVSPPSLCVSLLEKVQVRKFQSNVAPALHSPSLHSQQLQQKAAFSFCCFISHFCSNIPGL